MAFISTSFPVFCAKTEVLVAFVCPNSEFEASATLEMVAWKKSLKFKIIPASVMSYRQNGR